MIFDKMLEESYLIDLNKYSRLNWLSEYIFDFDTYETKYSELFARYAIDVCKAINDGETFEFIRDNDNRMWFLIMCNMPFFKKRITWGTSIRGAFWDSGTALTLNSCGLYHDGEQIICDITFSDESWAEFVDELIKFADNGKIDG